MFGKTLRGRTYYACQPGLNLGQAAADRHPDHPGSIWVREDGLLDGLHQLLDERVFGPDRRELLAAELGHETTQRRDDHAARRAALERAIAQIGERQDRLIATLETRDDATGALFDRVRDRMDTLERERTAKVAALRELDQAAEPASDPGLLDALPTTTIDWTDVPAEFQRDLFDALHVQIRYDRTTNTAHGQVTLVGDTGNRVPDAISAETKEPGPTDRAGRSIVVRAPGRIRTCAFASGGRRSIP
jgi:site-specific DNA recombinase